MLLAVYLIVGIVFATIVFVKGGKFDTPVPFWRWLLLFAACILTWPLGTLILVYLVSEDVDTQSKG